MTSKKSAKGNFPPPPIDRFVEHLTLSVRPDESYSKVNQWYLDNRDEEINFANEAKRFLKIVPQYNWGVYYFWLSCFFLAQKDAQNAFIYATKALGEPPYRREQASAIQNLARRVLDKKPLPHLGKLVSEGIKGIGDLSDTECDISELELYRGILWLTDYSRDNFGRDYPDVRGWMEGNIDIIRFKLHGHGARIFRAPWWQSTQRTRAKKKKEARPLPASRP